MVYLERDIKDLDSPGIATHQFNLGFHKGFSAPLDNQDNIMHPMLKCSYSVITFHHTIYRKLWMICTIFVTITLKLMTWQKPSTSLMMLKNS